MALIKVKIIFSIDLINKLFYNRTIIMKKSLICFTLVVFFLSAVLSAEVERRTAIDVGSGSMKVAIGDVETETNQVVAIVWESSFPVPYQASLNKSADGTFDKETKELAIKTFKEIKEISDSFHSQKITAIATSAFRKANNGKKFVSEIQKQTEIKVSIIPQREEGQLAFFSALSTGAYNPQEILVWDIGTGSVQMTVMSEEKEMIVYMGENMGSVAFMSYIIDTIQEKEGVETPNPLSDEDLKEADKYARSFARKAYPLIKQKIQNEVSILGAGRLFNHSVYPLASEGGVITRNGLRKFINDSLNKSDEELDNPYANVDVSNCILVLAIMKALHIHEIFPVETSTAKGMLIFPAYWH